MAVDLQRGDTELRESEARLRFLVEGIPQVFWLLELDPARVLYVGPAFERVWGRRAADLYTDPNIWIEGIHPEDRDRAQAAFRDWLAGRNAMHDVTYRVVRPDGSERWVRDRGARLETSSGGRMRVIGIAEDVTEQRCREAEQKELERKLQETQKLESLGVLAGGIAHDFNNLLTGIIGNASLARQDLSATSPARPSLEQIEETALRAADLCKQMLAYSGKGRFQIQRLDLSAVVRETMRLIQLSIAKTAVLRFELADSLPSVEADATQIRQVVMNLVINASEALGGKSGVISINTGLVRADRTYLDNTILSDTLPEGQYAFLEVSDNGCGMTAEQQARIFEPFFTTKFTGRGLGLSAVLGIVRGHHGALRVYSEEGKGTTFKILLPVAEGPADSVIAAQHDGQWTGIGIVLVVDDEPSVRNVATRMLQKIGFTVLTAADGREGLDVFRARRGEIVAVLMDLTMPHMDGESAFRELRALEPGVRVILMSGFNEQEAINRFTGKGLAGFMQKPFAIETLRRKLEETLGTR
jgi:PAS domain S-box-containing protein